MAEKNVFSEAAVGLEPRDAIETSQAFSAEAMALEAQLAAGKKDVSAFQDTYRAFGSGAWKMVTDIVGLPGSALDWGYRTIRQGMARDAADMAYEDTGKRDAVQDSLALRIGEGGGGSADPADTAMLSKLTPSGADIRKAIGGERYEDYKPTTGAGKFGEFLGENVVGGYGLAFGAGKLGAKFANYGDRYARSKLGLATSEGFTAVAASGGQAVASELADRDEMGPIGKAATEMAGAVAGGFSSDLLQKAGSFGLRQVATAAATRTPDGTNPGWLVRAFSPHQSGQQYLAAKIIQASASDDPIKIAGSIDSFASSLPEGRTVYTAAQQSGDLGLTALLYGIAGARARSTGMWKQAEADLNTSLHDFARRNISGGAVQQMTPEGLPVAAGAASATRVFAEIATQGVEQLELRMQAAWHDAHAAAKRVGPELGNRMKASEAAAKAMDSAYADARTYEATLWAPFKNDKTPISSQPIKDRMAAIEAEAKTLGNPEDFPAAHARLIKGVNKTLAEAEKQNVTSLKAARDGAKPGEMSFIEMAMMDDAIKRSEAKLAELNGGKKTLDDLTTVDELQAYRSWLLDEARNAFKGSGTVPSNPKLGSNYANLADSVLDAINDGYRAAGAPDKIEMMGKAREYSKALNDNFTRGAMPLFLESTRRGARVTDPRKILQQVTGGDFDANLASMDTLAAERFANDARVKLTPEYGPASTPIADMTEGYLASRYQAEVIEARPDGTWAANPERHKRFVESRKELLDQFPTLRANLDDANVRSEMAGRVQADVDLQRQITSDKSRNALALWLDGDPETAMRRLLEAPNQKAFSRDLVEQAKRDPSGAALQGLREALFEEMLVRTRLGARDAMGQNFTSGNRISTFISENRGAISEIMDKEQIVALKNFENEVHRAEKVLNMRAMRGGSNTAQSGAIINMFNEGETTMANMLRAAFGVGRFAGVVQNSLPFLSNAARGMDQELANRVMDTVTTAVMGRDPELLKTLLLKPTNDNIPRIQLRLRPYMALPVVDAAQEESQ